MSELEPHYSEEVNFMEGFSLYLTNCNKLPQPKAKMYVNMMRKFHNHVGKPYGDIKQYDVQSYLSSLKKYEHLKDRSIYVHLVAIKKFYQYLWSKGEVANIPSDGLRIKYRKKASPPKIRKRKPDSGNYY